MYGEGHLNGALGEHPIIFIDKLLKLGIGDKGRLLYLRNYLKNGKPLYDSDRKFLETMEHKLYEHTVIDFDKSFYAENSESTIKNSDISPKFTDHKFAENYFTDEFSSSSEFDSELLQIQNSIGDLQKSNSKLKDNLELISMSRQNLQQQKLEYTNSDKNSSDITKEHKSKAFSLFKNSKSSNSKPFKLQKHDVMVYSSAGLFTLWYISFQNIVDLGSAESIFLGLSAACAVSAGIFYKQHKSSLQKLE